MLLFVPELILRRVRRKQSMRWGQKRREWLWNPSLCHPSLLPNPSHQSSVLADVLHRPFWRAACTSCPVSWLGGVYSCTCPEMDPRKNGHEASAYLAEFLFSRMSSWPGRRMSASPGLSHVKTFFFFSPLAILYSTYLSQMCCSLICAENRFIGF